MRHAHTRQLLAAAALVGLAGCGGSAYGGSSSSGAATTAPGGAQGSTATATVSSATVSGHGSVLVAASNGMTLYEFAKGTANSGTSACTGTCISEWPPLTVSAGSTPVSKIGGTWGTITRSDGGRSQVTYNGLPLYFFSGETKPGDGNGNYPEWADVPAGSGAAAAGAAGASSPTATPGY